MEGKWSEEWTMNSFTSLLTDAIEFDILAQNRQSYPFTSINRFCRASFISAVLSIESAANSCVARMNYPKLVVEQIDKLSTLDKYAVLYSARFQKNINRGNKPFQVVKELFYLRNRYMHPKLENRKIDIEVDPLGRKVYENAPSKKTKVDVLKIPIDFTTWTGDHTRIIVKEVIAFYNYFFSKLCGLGVEECSQLLSVFVKGPANTATLLPTHEIEILRKVKEEYGIEISFLAFTK